MSLTLRVRDVTPATPRSRIVRLDLSERPFPYDAGQAVLVGTSGLPTRRPYSLAAAPEDAARDGWLELLVQVDERAQAPAGLSLTPGAAIEIDGPRGSFTFPPDPVERRVLFVAGGLGIAPLRAMLRHALVRAGDWHLALVYSARTAEEFAFQEELRALAGQGRLELRLRVTREGGGRWVGERGRISPDVLRPLLTDEATLCFVCGPPALVDEVPRQLAQLGISRERIKIEEWK